MSKPSRIILTKDQLGYGEMLPYTFLLVTDIYAREKRKLTTSWQINRMFELNKPVRN